MECANGVLKGGQTIGNEPFLQVMAIVDTQEMHDIAVAYAMAHLYKLHKKAGAASTVAQEIRCILQVSPGCFDEDLITARVHAARSLGTSRPAWD